MVIFRTLLFTVLVPGSVTVWIPALMLRSGARSFPHGSGARSLSLLGQ